MSLVLLVQVMGAQWILRGPALRWPAKIRSAIVIIAAASSGLAVFAFLLRFARVTRYFSPWWYGWGRGLMMAWAFLSMLLVIAFAVSHVFPHTRPEHSPARRNFLRAARVMLFAAPAAAVGYGVFIERLSLRMREQAIAIPGLHPDLDGLRIAQLTDIHLSPFLPIRVLEEAVAMANETRPHIVLVTGDLISTAADPVDLCLQRLTALRSDSGTFGCLGNHEIYADREDYVTEHGARLGIRFLRLAAVPLRFGNAVLNLGGVDYQHFRSPYLLGAEELIVPGALNLLMSHNPDVFEVAARQGWDFTMAGHTHGGQVRVEILRQSLNVARFFTPYVDGIYRKDNASIFVSRGIGTIGAPLRLGCAPEVALVRLCRT